MSDYHDPDCDCADCHEGDPVSGALVALLIIGFAVLMSWVTIAVLAS